MISKQPHKKQQQPNLTCHFIKNNLWKAVQVNSKALYILQSEKRIELRCLTARLVLLETDGDFKDYNSVEKISLPSNCFLVSRFKDRPRNHGLLRVFFI